MKKLLRPGDAARALGLDTATLIRRGSKDRQWAELAPNVRIRVLWFRNKRMYDELEVQAAAQLLRHRGR